MRDIHLRAAFAVVATTTLILCGGAADAAPIYLNSQNISVRLGPTMAAAPFKNQTTAISLANVIDVPSAKAREDHISPTTHVWVSGGPLELVFDLGAEYDLSALHFWNYYSEDYDVDNIAFTFFDSSNTVVGTLDVAPALGGAGGNPIAAEDYALSFPSNVRIVKAVLTGTNGEVDFTNIGFTAKLSDPLAVRERATGSLSVVSVVSDMQRSKKPSKNLLIILDSSGSMKERLGKTTRWGTAMEVFQEVVEKLPDDFNVGLRVYSHRHPPKSSRSTVDITRLPTCTDTELLVPVQTLNRGQILSAISRLKPRGETPLVYSVLQAIGDLKEVDGGSVVLISDGEETCKGDPLAAAKQLNNAGIDITLHIVGFAIEGKKVEKQLTTFAEATGGRYYSAQSGKELARALLIAAVEKLPYSVFDAAGKQVGKGETGDPPEELGPGKYRVIVQVVDQELVADNVSIASNKETVLKVVLKEDRFVLPRWPPQSPPLVATPKSPTPEAARRVDFRRSVRAWQGGRLIP